MRIYNIYTWIDKQERYPYYFVYLIDSDGIYEVLEAESFRDLELLLESLESNGIL